MTSRRPHRPARPCLPSVAAGGLLILGLAALSIHAAARAQASPVAQPDWGVPTPHLQGGPTAPPAIEPVAPAAPPRIEAHPRDDAAAIAAPPPAAPEPLLPGDARSQAVERELQRLMRAAYTGGAYGATPASAQAAWLLGLIHLHGAGVPIDTASAEQWFSRAARQGREPWAFAGLAWCHLEGCAGPPDPAAADRAIARLRLSHPARADFLAWLRASRLQPLQAAAPSAAQEEAPPAPSAQLLERAAAAGDLHANIELGLQAFAGQRLEPAAQFFRRVAPRSSVAAANLREVEARLQAGSAPPRPAAEADAAAALAQARRYHRGEGVPANFAEAIRFYRLAEQRGSAEARRMLALIASRPAPDGGFNVPWMQQLAHVDAGASIPRVGAAAAAHPLQREPSPLFDLLPPAWQRRMAPVGR